MSVSATVEGYVVERGIRYDHLGLCGELVVNIGGEMVRLPVDPLLGLPVNDGTVSMPSPEEPPLRVRVTVEILS